MTEIVHETPAASVLLQLFVSAKPVLAEMELMVSAAEPAGLLRVTTCGAETVPTSW